MRALAAFGWLAAMWSVVTACATLGRPSGADAGAAVRRGADALEGACAIYVASGGKDKRAGEICAAMTAFREGE